MWLRTSDRQTFQRRNELWGHEFPGLQSVWVDLLKPWGWWRALPCLAPTVPAHSVLRTEAGLGGVGDPGSGGKRSGGEAGRLPWEPPLPWVSVPRMPWKGMSSLHLRGDESASYLLPRARLLCPMWAVVPGEEMDRVEVATSHAGSHWGQEEASSPLAQTSALSRR